MGVDVREATAEIGDYDGHRREGIHHGTMVAGVPPGRRGFDRSLEWPGTGWRSAIRRMRNEAAARRRSPAQTRKCRGRWNVPRALVVPSPHGRVFGLLRGQNHAHRNRGSAGTPGRENWCTGMPQMTSR